MEELWTVIAIVLTGCVVVVTYYFAQVLHELARNFRDLRGTIKNVNTITTNVVHEQEMINDVLETVRNTTKDVAGGIENFREQLLTPLTSLMNFLQGFLQQVVDRRSHSEEYSESDE